MFSLHKYKGKHCEPRSDCSKQDQSDLGPHCLSTYLRGFKYFRGRQKITTFCDYAF